MLAKSLCLSHVFGHGLEVWLIHPVHSAAERFSCSFGWRSEPDIPAAQQQQLEVRHLEPLPCADQLLCLKAHLAWYRNLPGLASGLLLRDFASSALCH